MIFPQPTLKGVDLIGIRRFITVYFFENFEKAIIQYLDGVVFVVGVTVADGHGISVKRVVNLF